jgi:hypothetical protein
LLEEKIKVIWNTVQAACLKSLWYMGKSEFLAGRKGGATTFAMGERCPCILTFIIGSRGKMKIWDVLSCRKYERVSTLYIMQCCRTE